jgi:hypothetical protein
MKRPPGGGPKVISVSVVDALSIQIGFVLPSLRWFFAPHMQTMMIGAAVGAAIAIGEMTST